MTSDVHAASGLALVLLAASACAGGASSPPAVLSDGSAARPPPVALEGIDAPSVLTRLRAQRPSSIEPGSRTARCIDSAPASATAIVAHVGVSGSSVTVLGPSGRTVYACDASAGPATDGSSWCGHAFGRLDTTGRLRDPRLSLTCRNVDDQPLGFAWIRPDAAAAYLVVGRSGYSEVYPVPGRVPVRVVTDDVDQGNASATFSVSEHARDGRRLAAYEIEARVSG